MAKKLTAIQDPDSTNWVLVERFRILPHRLLIEQARTVFVAEAIKAEGTLSAGQRVAVELHSDYHDDTDDPFLGEPFDSIDLQQAQSHTKFVQATVYTPANIVLQLEELDSTTGANGTDSARRAAAKRRNIALFAITAVFCCFVPIVWMRLTGAPETPSNAETTTVLSTAATSVTTETGPKNSDAIDLTVTGLRGYPQAYLDAFDHLKARDYVAADFGFQQLVKQNSIFGDIGMGYSFLYRRDYVHSQRWFEAAIQKGVNDHSGWTLLNGYMITLQRQDEIEQARQIAREILKMPPVTGKHYNYRVEAFVVLGDDANATLEIDNAERVEPGYRRYFANRYPNL